LRVAADILKWQSGRMTPKLYGDRQQVDVQKVEGGSYLDLLTKVNDAAMTKAIESREDTQLDKVRARANEINHISVNNDMPKKQANRQKKGKKLSTGS
jgi:mannose/fructose-specific phosphotransferase system component IIA